MKVMLRSRSNLPSLTHQWNLISSIWIPLSARSAYPLLCCISKRSLTPNLHSGIPLNQVLTTILPFTSAFSTVPLFESNTFTDSIISMQISFLRYTKPSARQETDPVARTVIYFSFSMSVSYFACFPVRIYSFRRFASVIYGYP